MNEKIVVVKHVENEGPGLIENLFKRNGWEIETVELAKGEALPESLKNVAAVIMLGGPMSANDIVTYPFLQNELAFIEKVLKEETPFLGICLGAQLLAKACGGEVFKAPHEEIGWYPIDVTENGQKDILFRDVSKNIVVFQWHEDTFAIPHNGRHLAQSDLCINQAFKVGNNAYGLQFHIEVTPDMVKSWMEGVREDVDAARIINDTAMIMDFFKPQYKKILMNFERLIESYLRYKKIICRYIENEDVSAKKKQIPWWEMEELHVGLTLTNA
jgi:GMP synthase (glutamine-hydrolysing)